MPVYANFSLSHGVRTTLSGTFDAGSVDRAPEREPRAAQTETSGAKPRRGRDEGSRSRGGRSRGGRSRGGRRRPERREDEVVEPFKLFDELVERELLSTHVFSFSLKDYERLARRVARRGLLHDDEGRRMDELQEELIAPEGTPLMRCEILVQGVYVEGRCAPPR